MQSETVSVLSWNSTYSFYQFSDRARSSSGFKELRYSKLLRLAFSVCRIYWY